MKMLPYSDADIQMIVAEPETVELIMDVISFFQPTREELVL
jgi:hypothetical protein